MSPQPKGGGGGGLQIVFGADPVGVGVRVASFPRVIFWTDGRILTKLAQIHCWEGGTSWLDFGDLGPIFKVTATFFNVWNFVSVRYLMNQWTNLYQTCTDTMLGGCEKLIWFWWPFKVTATFCNVWNFVSGCSLLNQWTYFDQTCIDTMFGGCEELIRLWWPWLNFQGHSDLF